MSSVQLRVTPATHQQAQRIAERTGESLTKVVARAVDELNTKLFWEQVHQEYARLKSDPVAWQEELAERREWNETLTDGLSDDPYEE